MADNARPPVSETNPAPSDAPQASTGTSRVNYGRILRERRNINDDQYVSLLTNLIRAALPFARPFLQALDIVMEEEAAKAGESGDTESQSELDETPFVTESASWSWLKEGEKTAPIMWYAVVRGTRVGVFKDLKEVDRITSRVPNNSKRSFRNKSDAIAYWNDQQAKGEVYVIIKESEDKLDMSGSVQAKRPPAPKPLQVELVSSSTVSVKAADPVTEAFRCPMHKQGSSVHDSDIPDSPNPGDDFSPPLSDNGSLDFMAALQKREGVDAQVRALEEAQYAEYMIECAQEDANFKRDLLEKRLRAEGGSLEGEAGKAGPSSSKGQA